MRGHSVVSETSDSARFKPVGYLEDIRLKGFGVGVAGQCTSAVGDRHPYFVMRVDKVSRRRLTCDKTGSSVEDFGEYKFCPFCGQAIGGEL